MRFTIADYHRMVEVGILDEDDKVELLDGEIVFMAAMGYPHKSITDMLNMYFAPLVVGQFICRVQSSIELPEMSEPQPDFLILDHADHFYRKHDPKIEEIRLLVEVADTSLDKDLKRKRRIYAAAGVAEY